MARRGVITVLLLLAISVASVHAADAPAAKPAVPALLIGDTPPRTFIVRGITRFTATEGFAYYIASDGKRQVCALYDPADGTPIFLSDGQQSLIYDLANDRIVRLPSSRGYIRVEWNAQSDKPLGFSLGVDYRTDPAKLPESNSRFRIDQFVAATPAFERSRDQDNAERFAAERKGKYVEAVKLRAGDHAFSFTSTSKGESYASLELHATNIGQPLPEGALAFPDLTRLKQQIRVQDIDEQMLPTFVVMLRDGRAWMAKMALAGGEVIRGSARKLMPTVDWDALRKRDAALGAAYRKALAEQGIDLAAEAKPISTPPKP
jgi:hypothetical protein